MGVLAIKCICLNFESYKEYVSVRQKTCALHNACETLLHEQTRLTDNAEAIHEKLSYFQELDSIKSRLKNPNLEVNSGLVSENYLSKCVGTYFMTHKL